MDILVVMALAVRGGKAAAALAQAKMAVMQQLIMDLPTTLAALAARLRQLLVHQ
jgi:hypothetical protein